MPRQSTRVDTHIAATVYRPRYHPRATEAGCEASAQRGIAKGMDEKVACQLQATIVAPVANAVPFDRQGTAIVDIAAECPNVQRRIARCLGFDIPQRVQRGGSIPEQ